eukprot:SAG25_NODE_8_length_29132_cov_108.213895_23_plen_870_part_00
MNEKNNLTVLGLQMGATEAQIKKAYYLYARRWHPDKAPGELSAAAKFRRVKDAYDDLLQEKYDHESDRDEEAAAPMPSYEDLFAGWRREDFEPGELVGTVYDPDGDDEYNPGDDDSMSVSTDTDDAEVAALTTGQQEGDEPRPPPPPPEEQQQPQQQDDQQQDDQQQPQQQQPQQQGDQQQQPQQHGDQQQDDQQQPQQQQPQQQGDQQQDDQQQPQQQQPQQQGDQQQQPQQQGDQQQEASEGDEEEEEEDSDGDEETDPLDQYNDKDLLKAVEEDIPQRQGIDVAKNLRVNAYVRDTASTGGAAKIDNPNDKKMAEMALEFDRRRFGTQITKKCKDVFATNENNTWDMGDSSLFLESLNAVLPFAKSHNALAVRIFSARYPAVIDKSLPLNSQPRQYRKHAAFKRDLQQLKRCDQAVHHLQDDGRQNKFMSMCVKLTKDDDILEKLLPKHNTGLWYFSNVKYDPETHVESPYVPEDYIRSCFTVGFEGPMLKPSDGATVAELENFELDLSLDNPELVTSLRNMGCACMGDGVLKQFYLLKGPSDSGKTTWTLLIVLITGQMMSEKPTESAGRGYQTNADYWLREQKQEFDEWLAGAMGATVWITEEPKKDGRFVLNNLKFQTGGQPIRPALKHGHNTPFQPTHTIIIGLNDSPAIDETEKGIPERGYVHPFTAKFVVDPAPGTNQRKKDGMLDIQLRMPAHERALRWRDEYCRMLGQHFRDVYKPAVIDSGLMRIPKCDGVQTATDEVFQVSEAERIRREPVKHFLEDDNCPFEVVPDDASAMAPYCLFVNNWKDEFQVKYGPIPAADKFKQQITALDGITYSSDRKTSPQWPGQKNPYVGVRLRNQPNIPAAVAAATAATARASSA